MSGGHLITVKELVAGAAALADAAKLPAGARKVEGAHVWELEPNQHYVEEQWCDDRFFEVEKFDGTTQDPCCGFGRVVMAGRRAGVPMFGTDLVDRGFADILAVSDFLTQRAKVDNVVGNPPFNIFPQFAQHALSLTSKKVALIWLVRRLAAATWLEQTPLFRIYYMNPRPSMPPGFVVTAADRGDLDPETGEPIKVGGGKQDFCWLVWDHNHKGPATTHWLRRDP